MILRRFMKHVTDQNWFAVGLDVIVVIVGIFLGLQVQDWANRQMQREQESVYINQLHAEVLAITEEVQRRQDSTKKRMERMVFLTNYLTGEPILEPINNDYCSIISFAHIFNNPAFPLTTISEVTSSGQLPIITDQKLRSLISDYALLTELYSLSFPRLSTGSFQLPALFPQLIRLGPITIETSAGELSRVNECDLASMSDNWAFKNKLSSNTARQFANYENLVKQNQLLQQLHDRLDHLLDLSHD